jgi:hypothetical protein
MGKKIKGLRRYESREGHVSGRGEERERKRKKGREGNRLTMELI